MVNAIVRVREGAIGDPILGFGAAIRKGSVTLYITSFFHPFIQLFYLGRWT